MIATHPLKPSVSVVIGSLNRRDFLTATIATVRRELSLEDREIIVVDGGSDDGTLEWLMSQTDVITIVQHNRPLPGSHDAKRRPWGYFMNLGFRAATAPVVCMLSDDCLVVPGAITNGLEILRSSGDVGAVAFYWRNWPEQRSYRVGYTFGDNLFVNHGLYRKKALEAVNFADDDRFSFYHADGDLCLRLWQEGWSCKASPKSFVEHYSHANVQQRTMNATRVTEDWTSYAERWGSLGEPKREWDLMKFTDEHRTAEKYWRRPSRFNTAKVRARLALDNLYRRTTSTIARSS